MRAIGLLLLAFGIVLGFVAVSGTLMALGRLPAWGAELLLVFLLLDAVSVVMLIAAVAVLRRGRPIGAVPTPVNGKVGAYVWNAPSNQELDGSPYAVLYLPPVKGKNGRPSSLRISTPVATKGECHVTRETWFDRLCKRFGLAREVQTGDADFDSACYVRSDTPEFAAAYLTDAMKRVAIVDLRRFGFPEVTIKDGTISATWHGFDPIRNDRPELAPDVAARLILLARNLPPHQPEFDHRVGTHRMMWQVVLWVFLVAFAVMMVSLIAFPPIVTSDLVGRIVPGIALGLVAFASISAWLLHGTSTAHYAWARLVLGSLILLPLGSVGTGAFINGVPDRSPEVTHTAAIVEKYTTKSKSKTKYHVRCALWREPGRTVSFEISAHEHAAVVVGQSKMVVTTRAGWLGAEWLKRSHLELQPKNL